MVYAICNPDNIEKLRRAIAEEIKLLLDRGITPTELEAGKKGYLQQEQLSRTRDAGLAQTLVSNLAVNRTMKFQAQFENRISELTAQQVIAAMRKHIDPKRLYIVTAGDFGKGQAVSGR